MILLHKPKGAKISDEIRDKILTFLYFEKGGSFGYAAKQKKNKWLYSNRWEASEEKLSEIFAEEGEAIIVLNSHTDQTRESERVPIYKPDEDGNWMLLFQAGPFNEISSGFSTHGGSQYNNGYAGIHKLYDNFLKFLEVDEAKKIIDEFANKGANYPSNGYFISIDSGGCTRHGNLWKEIEGVFYSSDLWKHTAGLSKDEREKKKLSTPIYGYTPRGATKIITQYGAKKSIVAEDEGTNLNNIFLGLSFAEISANMKATYTPRCQDNHSYVLSIRAYSPLFGELPSGPWSFNSISYAVSGKFERYVHNPKLFELNSIKDGVHKELKADKEVRVTLTLRDLNPNGVLREFEITLIPNERIVPKRGSNNRDSLIAKLEKRIRDSSPTFDFGEYSLDEATEEDLAAFAASFGIDA